MNHTCFQSIRRAGAVLALAALTPFAVADGKMVIKAGKVVTLAGEPIENGTIVIENGRVTAVGVDVEAPWDAEVLEYPDMVAFPGFVEALTNSGMDRANENIDVAAFLDVRDSIDPVNFYFENALRAGVTTVNVQHGDNCVVGANGHVVKPFGMTVEEMSVKPGAGLVLSASPKGGKSPATQAQALRATFRDLRLYLEEVVQDKKDGNDKARREALYQGREPDEETSKGRAMEGTAWTVEGLETVPRWEIDEKQAPLLKLVEGRTPAFFYCGGPKDVHTAIRIAEENGFLARTTLVLSSSCWKAADVIAERGLPVILSSNLVHTEEDPATGEEIETFVPGVFAEKGVRFALRSASSLNQSLWFQAARCIGHGMTREQAIAAVTTTPAELLGLGDRVGSLAAGHDANVVLFSGDPLSVTSRVEYVVIEGELVYDRSKDVRMRHLETGAQPENTSPDDGSEFDPHPEDDADDEADDEGESEDEGEDA